MQSIIQVLKLNEPKTGTSKKTGQPYDMQDAECLLLDANGNIDQVGVLQIPKSLRGKVTVGKFTASFALQANYADRRIGAVLADVIPLPDAALPAKAPKAAS